MVISIQKQITKNTLIMEKQKNQKISDYIRDQVESDPKSSDRGYNEILAKKIANKFKVNCTANAVQKRRERMGILGKEEEVSLTTEEKILRDRALQGLKTKNNESDKKYKFLLDEINAKEKEIEAVLQSRAGLKSQEIVIRPSSGKNEAVAVVVASDWHLEEIVKSSKVNGMNESNVSIAKKRATEFFQNTLKLVQKEQQNASIETLVLALLGDFISSNIHDELLENCELRPIEAMIEAQNTILSGIEFLLANSKLKLIIPCHVGNHTRITKKVHLSTEQGNSLEYFMYHNLKNYFKNNKRVEFLIAEGYHSYVKIFDFTIRFHHGHSMNYGGGIGGLFIPAFKAISQWQKIKHADLDCFGHFHQVKDGGNFLCNGSLIGYNAFALAIKADYERPKQLFFLIDKKRGRTVSCPITFSV